MPGFDRTGPFGEGPMTGGRRGVCNQSARRSIPAFRNSLGYGRGLRIRQGFRGKRFYPMSATEEINRLKDEADYLKNSLDAINRRLNELEKEPPEGP